MKRDMELVRAILMAVAELPPGRPLLGMEGVSREEFAAHAQWLDEAGLVESALQGSGRRPPTSAAIWRLTWSGCDAVDAMRDESLWKQAVDTVIRPSASWTFGILLEWLKHRVLEQLGPV